MRSLLSDRCDDHREIIVRGQLGVVDRRHDTRYATLGNAAQQAHGRRCSAHWRGHVGIWAIERQLLSTRRLCIVEVGVVGVDGTSEFDHAGNQIKLGLWIGIGELQDQSIQIEAGVVDHFNISPRRVTNRVDWIDVPSGVITDELDRGTGQRLQIDHHRDDFDRRIVRRIEHPVGLIVPCGATGIGGVSDREARVLGRHGPVASSRHHRCGVAVWGLRGGAICMSAHVAIVPNGYGDRNG